MYPVVTVFVGALASFGLRHACVSPGSRNTPLLLALEAHPNIDVWVHHDERSAAFFALGLAKEQRAPVAIACTSGTAATEFLPGLTEARYSHVPLIALTADRPPELQGIGSPQTIDQNGLFGPGVKWWAELDSQGSPTGSAAAELASSVWRHATETPAGPVHVNVPLREPLLPDLDDALVAPVELDQTAVMKRELQPEIEPLPGERPIIVVGAVDDPDVVDSVVTLGRAWGAPILADPLSGLRTGSHDKTHVVAHGDLLAGAGWLDRVAPDTVIRIGGIPTSKPIWRWLADHRDVPQMLVDPAKRDATRSARVIVASDPAATSAQLARRVDAVASSWLERWHHADRAASHAVHTIITRQSRPTEPGVVAALHDQLPNPSQLYIGSSMPIRDVDSFFSTTDKSVRMYGNRGANGIDGLISAGLGAGATGTPTVVLSGDLAALYDLTALVTARRYGLDVTIVVIHNDGGGIFHFLDQAQRPEFEKLFATPHGTDFVAAARGLGIDAEQIDTLESLPLTGPRLIQVRTDRAANVELHQEIRDTVAATLRD